MPLVEWLYFNAMSTAVRTTVTITAIFHAQRGYTTLIQLRTGNLLA